jgi:hypothetical protein
MPNVNQFGTNAADSAPGVNDGPVRPGRAPVNSKPGGRRAVWLGVAMVLVLLAVITIAKPWSPERASEPTLFGQTQADLQQSPAPGKQTP